MANGFLFANNLMLDTSKTLKRTDKVSTTALRKLDFLISKASDQDLILVLCGEVFSKTFCIKTLSECIDRLKSIECLILADGSQMKNKDINPKSTLGILDRAGIVKAIHGNEVSKRVEIEDESGGSTFGIVGNRHNVLNDEITIDQGLFGDLKCIYVGDFKVDMNFSGCQTLVKPYEVQNCALVIASGNNRDCLETKVGRTLWATTGIALRTNPKDESIKPSYLVYKPDSGVCFESIPSDEFVFDPVITADSNEEVSNKSNFARKLRDECTHEGPTQGKLNKSSIDKLCDEKDISLSAREVIYRLEKSYHATK